MKSCSTLSLWQRSSRTRAPTAQPASSSLHKDEYQLLLGKKDTYNQTKYKTVFICYVTRTQQLVLDNQNVFKCQARLTYFFKSYLRFKLKCKYSIPDTPCQVSNMNTRSKMKSPSNVAYILVKATTKEWVRPKKCIF